MDLDLPEELIAVQKLAHDFAEKEISPSVVEDDRQHTFRRDLVRKMADLGIFGCVVPEAYGGTDLGFLALALISEEIARVHSALRSYIVMQCSPALTLLHCGSEEQKRRYIPALVSGETLSCFAITEPNAGSDVASMTTRAKKDGSNFVLSGTKTWITSATVADTAVVFAYTDRSKGHHGMSVFYVDLNQPGVTRRTLEKLGAHASPTGELVFDDVVISGESLIGAEGEGFKNCMNHLNHSRLSCAAGAVGLARAARETAVAYARQREQFGHKIGEFQMIQDLVAQMVVHEEAARLLVHRAAALADQRKPYNRETSIAKYFAAEAAAFNADAAMKILGAYGYSTEFPVERYFRDAKFYQIVEGSSNIQKLIIARDALDYKKANR